MLHTHRHFFFEPNGVAHENQTRALVACVRESQPQRLKRPIIHVVAREARQWEAISQLINASGYNAALYHGTDELVEQKPFSGFVLVHEADELGASAVCKALHRNALWLPVIGFGAEIDASRIVKGMKSGAFDFLVGQISSETLVAKLRECAIEAGVALAGRARKAKAQSALASLSIRECQVLDLLSNGMSNKQMARQLGLSPRTIEIHRMKMMGKVGANSVAHAVSIRIYALEHNLTDRSVGASQSVNTTLADIRWEG